MTRTVRLASGKMIEMREIKDPSGVPKEMLLITAIVDIGRHGGFAGHREIIRWFEERGLEDKRTVSIAEDVLEDMGLLDGGYKRRPDGKIAWELQVCKHADDLAEVVHGSVIGAVLLRSN